MRIDTTYASTHTTLPVAEDISPPVIVLSAVEITNQSPVTVTDVAESGASVTVDGVAVSVKTSSGFTANVALNSGANIVQARATGTNEYMAYACRLVWLDTTPPLLNVTSPQDRWRRVNAPHLAVLAKDGVEFPNGEAEMLQRDSEPEESFMPMPWILAADGVSFHNV